MNPKPESRYIDEKIRRALPQAGQPNKADSPVNHHMHSEAKKPSSRGPLYIILLGVFACLVFVFAGVMMSATPAVASMLQGAPTSTQDSPHFAQAQFNKPTSTPEWIFTPSLTPTDPPTITPTVTLTPDFTFTPLSTETPALVEMAIVPDTPTPERAYVQAPDAAPSYSGNKYILVDISEQHMYVYEGDVLIWSFVASTGMNNATRAGLFHVQDKIPNAYGATWNIWMPNWLGIYYAGGLENGIHALPILPNGARLWSGWLGTPISYGCVVLGEYESELLYNWAEIGTPVEIRR
jgi:lipoprotein-anchoring transpeptidase ErfK/SrfK